MTEPKPRRRKRTAKEIVLAKYPKARSIFAFLSHNCAGYGIVDEGQHPHDTRGRAQRFAHLSKFFRMQRQAWSDAATRIKEARRAKR